MGKIIISRENDNQKTSTSVLIIIVMCMIGGVAGIIVFLPFHYFNKSAKYNSSFLCVLLIRLYSLILFTNKCTSSKYSV